MPADTLLLSPHHAGQLLIAKYLRDRAERELDPALPVSAGLAVSLCQDAAELVIWTIAKDVDARISEKAAFDQMWDEIPKGPRNQGNKSLPDRGLMRDVNRARVNFKHYGQVPSYADAVRFLAYTDNFTRAAVRDFYGAEWDSLSRANLVKDEAIAAELRVAEDLLHEEKFKECVFHSAVAYRSVMSVLESILPRVDLPSSGAPFGPPTPATHLSIHRSILATALLGIPYGDSLKFMWMAPRVLESPVTGSRQFVDTFIRQRYTQDDATFCVSYVIETALRVQALKLPFTAIRPGAAPFSALE